MSIKITCLQCGATHKVNDRLAGRRVRCPGCDTAVHVPELPEPSVPVEVEAVEVEAVDTKPAPSAGEVVDAAEVAAAGAVAGAANVAGASTGAPAPSGQSASATSGQSGSGSVAAELLDDDDDDVMKREQRAEDELDMTPMVDVTFLLLIFFVVTASFQLQKSIMMPRQQTDAPSTSAVEEDPEELDQVELQIDDRGTFLVLAADWEAETPGKQNLITKLKEARPGDVGAKLIIKVHEQCKLQALVDGMDAGTIAGYDELQVTQVEDFD